MLPCHCNCHAHCEVWTILQDASLRSYNFAFSLMSFRPLEGYLAPRTGTRSLVSWSGQGSYGLCHLTVRKDFIFPPPSFMILFLLLNPAEILHVLYKINKGAERWCSSEQHILAFLKTHIHFPVPTSGASQPPIITPGPSSLTPLSCIGPCTHTLILTHKVSYAESDIRLSGEKS